MNLINHLHIDINTVYKKKLCDHKSMHSYKKPLLKRIESLKKNQPIFWPNIHINTRLKTNSLVVFIKICMIHSETLLHFTGNWEKQQHAVCRISWNCLRWLVRLQNLNVFCWKGNVILIFGYIDVFVTMQPFIAVLMCGFYFTFISLSGCRWISDQYNLVAFCLMCVEKVKKLYQWCNERYPMN